MKLKIEEDHAGDQTTRKSLSSFQLFLDGNLVESKVRSQRAIALSTGEPELIAIVSGMSEGMLLKSLVKFLTKKDVDMIVRSDSSAARAMVQRQGIGKVRHIDASMLWVQQKVKAPEVEIR